MRPPLVVMGAFILILGFALMNLAPALTTASFYKEEAGLISKESNSVNATAALAQTVNDDVNAVNQAEIILLVGAVLAPVGGAVLALGLVSSKNKDEVQPMHPGVTSGP